jgi:hypothetical protein
MLTLEEAAKSDLRDWTVPRNLALDEIGNQQSMCQNSTLLVFCYFLFSFFHLLVSICFCWVSYLAYPNLLRIKGFVVV